MSPQKAIAFTKETVIPVGLVIVLFAGVWKAAEISKQVEINRSRITAIQEQVSTIPTRLEFEDLKSDISEIKVDIKSIISSLTKSLNF